VKTKGRIYACPPLTSSGGENEAPEESQTGSILLANSNYREFQTFLRSRSAQLFDEVCAR